MWVQAEKGESPNGGNWTTHRARGQLMGREARGLLCRTAGGRFSPWEPGKTDSVEVRLKAEGQRAEGLSELTSQSSACREYSKEGGCPARTLGTRRSLSLGTGVRQCRTDPVTACLPGISWCRPRQRKTSWGSDQGHHASIRKSRPQGSG